MSRILPPLLTLLAAFALRTWQLADIPPGLTHDEAGHAHDAAHILKGITPIYFTVGYGREPLFDYLNAGWIASSGANIFTFRFAAVAWGMLAAAATFRAARSAFDERTAIYALAFIALSFWPVATSRQILRSAMLPAETAFAVILFLKLNAAQQSGKSLRTKWTLAIALGIVLAASIYTYIPGRALWAMFPLAALLCQIARIVISRQGRTPSLFRSLVPSLLIAFALSLPLVVYLYQHPEAEQRLGMLSQPLDSLRHGDATPIITNMRETFLAFFVNGHGDHFLAYTIPGKPLFDPLTALLATAGILLLLALPVPIFLRTFAAPAKIFPSILFMLWLALGIAPALVTGPEALTTRIIGAQPVIYILPALALSRLIAEALALSKALPGAARRAALWPLAAVQLSFFALVAASTVRDYFFVWAQSPDVRAAYQSTLIAALRTVRGPTVISTVYPSAPHDPYIAELIAPMETRWADARLAMIFPASPAFQLIVPSSTPPHPAIAVFIRPIQTYTTRASDLDPAFTVYEMTRPPLAEASLVNFGGAVDLLNARWSAASFHPGDVAELIATWLVRDPSRLGAVHPPSFTTELNLFTHVLNADGTVYLQRDSLDAPSWDWQAGDVVIQVHPLAIPPDAADGQYAAEVGLYDRIAGERLPLRDSTATAAAVPPLVIRK